MRKKNVLFSILFLDTVISFFTTFVTCLLCQEYHLDIPPKYFLVVFLIVFGIVLGSMMIGYGLGTIEGEAGE